MELSLETFTNHKKQALEAYRQGGFPAARYQFLQAARYLALAARQLAGQYYHRSQRRPKPSVEH